MTEPDDTPLALSAHDLQSTLAGKLRKHVDARIHSLRAKNDGDLDPTATAKVRGELKALKGIKNLLALCKPDPVVVADDASPE